jgi:hypothetical protein
MGNRGFRIQRPLGHDPHFFAHRRLSLAEHSQKSSIHSLQSTDLSLARSRLVLGVHVVDFSLEGFELFRILFRKP